MDKFKRNERIGAIVKVISNSPNKIFTLNYFTMMFNAAKSTISEDLVIVKKMMEDVELGKVITISGAAGGVKFIPSMSKDKKIESIEKLCQQIKDSSRVIPGDFLYISDILCNPEMMDPAATIFAESFSGVEKTIDYVLTIETKGIPLAFLTAQKLDVPLVIARKESKVTEGAKISINYISGSTGKLQTMYISKKAIKPHSNVLIVDDFMRAGGTSKGMEDLVKELDSTVAGVCVILNSVKYEEKLVDNYMSLIDYYGIDENKNIKVEISNDFLIKMK